MAASGVTMASNVDSLRGFPNRSPAPNATTSHPQLTRKRSRSGTRIDAQSRRHGNGAILSTKDLLLDQYTMRDQVHIAAMIDDVERNKELLQSMTDEYKSLMDLGRAKQLEATRSRQGSSNMPEGPRVLYPTQRKRPGNRRTKELHVPKKERVKQSDQIEDLVPIRLDLEFEKLRLRDTFTWSFHDRTLPVDLFAEGLVEDFRIPPDAVPSFTQQVSQALTEQLADYHPHPFIDEEALNVHLPYYAYKNDEIRMLVKLNITLGNHTLVDQFDWDINNPHNSPEDFARQMGHDLSLSGEFITAIAHSIREQTQAFTKGLYISQHPFDGRPVEDADLLSALLPSPLPSIFRPFNAAKDFTPYFYELSPADLERTDLVFQREQRQQKRSVNRRGGPTLPDLKDRLKTWRTMLVSSVVPGAAETLETSGLIRAPRTSARAGAARRAGVRDDSDASESEVSDPDSPVAAALASTQGTARTRGIRGAATAAQAAMRAATMARSQTPEVSLVQGRWLDGGREDSVAEPTSLVVRLRMPRERYRQWLRDRKAMVAGGGGGGGTGYGGAQGYPQQQQQQGQQYGSGSMAPPPSTPGMMRRNLPGFGGAQSQQHYEQQAQQGRLAQPQGDFGATSPSEGGSAEKGRYDYGRSHGERY